MNKLIPCVNQQILLLTTITLTERSKYWFLFHHVVPPLGLSQGFSFLDIPRVPDPHTRRTVSVAPHSQDLLGPVALTVHTKLLPWQISTEEPSVHLDLEVVTEVGYQSLVALLATVHADLVPEDHLK